MISRIIICFVLVLLSFPSEGSKKKQRKNKKKKVTEQVNVQPQQPMPIKPVKEVPPLDRQLHISFRTSPMTNRSIYEDYLKKVGIPESNIMHGHLTYGWIRDIAEEDVQPLMAHVEYFVQKLDPLEYTFKIDRVGIYTHNRKEDDVPLILLPENGFPFVQLNHRLNEHVKLFQGTKGYELGLGTEPVHFVPHITIAHEKIVFKKKIGVEKTRAAVNKLIATNRQTYCFSTNLVKIKVKGGPVKIIKSKKAKKGRKKKGKQKRND